MGIGKTFGEAFGKAQQGAGLPLPKKDLFLSASKILTKLLW